MIKQTSALTILLQFTATPLFADEIQDGQGKPPVTARLIVKQEKYILPKNRQGEEFRKRIMNEEDSDKLPPPPKVDLILELTNISDADVMLWPRGSITEPDLIVVGKGVVEPENLRSFSGSSSGTSVQPTIKPGKTYRTRINSLNPQGGTPWYFWSEPGEYEITATYAVYTGLPPFPFPRPNEDKPTGKPTRYEVETPSVKVQVVLEEDQRPLVVGHRGLLRHAPENTLAGFRACLELRLGFEFDVRKTIDGDLVCIHDDTVDRTTDGVGYISEFSLDQIQILDAGRWFNPRYAGEKVPAVAEVFQLIDKYRHQDFLVAVDLKSDGFERIEEDIVRLAEKHKVLDRLLFIGNPISDDFLRRDLKEVSKQAQTAVVANNADEFSAALGATDGDWVYFRYLPTEKQIKAVHQAGKRAFIAGPSVSGNLPDNWRQAVDVGIDAVLTDYPLELKSALAEKSADSKDD